MIPKILSEDSNEKHISQNVFGLLRIYTNQTGWQTVFYVSACSDVHGFIEKNLFKGFVRSPLEILIKQLSADCSR